MCVKCTKFIHFAAIIIPIVKSAVPGTFYWKPRMGLTVDVPQTNLVAATPVPPTFDNIYNGNVVIFDGFHAGLTLLSLINGHEAGKKQPNHHNPLSPYFYTNVYRWILRYLDLFPEWLGQTSGHYTDTQKLWRRRYHYLDQFVPQWIRTILNVFVNKKEWAEEEKEFKKYLTYAETAFSTHYNYPTKIFKNFASQVSRRRDLPDIDSSYLSLHG